MYSDTPLETQAANAGLLAPTATDLLCDIENGDGDQVEAKIQMLGYRDFLTAFRAVRELERKLTNYALSWQGVQYLGESGSPFPDDAQAKA